MYAYIELSRITRTDSIIQSLSWMNYISNASPLISNPTDDRSLTNVHEGWLATGNTNNIVSVTYTSMKADEHVMPPDRTNFNLRAHRSDVRLVSWNVPYQKLATVDEKGVIFVWVKHENRWSLELINDRSHPVTDMCWSHDGRMTVICYEDGYILAGSVTGQRYWSTVVNNLQTKISAVAWLPDMSHVILGTTAGQLIVMDNHGNTTEVFTLSTHPIRQLMYSCDKFYPDAPDTNPTRFVNDDYILACSLDNGQVLFLSNYQDHMPIVVETDLQNIKLDWSSPGEILAIAGHKRVNDLLCTNEILFYTRRGELLHRTHIPQTNHPLSALCWAHDSEILFAACGSFVYTIWITHKSLPSMFTICQMKIKQYLSKTCADTLDRCALPENLKVNLLRLYPSIIKGFLPDHKHLRLFVCHPLKSHLRLQCTMKLLDHDQEHSLSTTHANNLSGATYVLYLEYLGGLIPLLTAKRISKICPDFIIFDPQMKTTDLSLLSSQKIKFAKKHFLSSKSRSNTYRRMSNVPQSKISLPTNRSSLIGNRNSIHVAATAPHTGPDDVTAGQNDADSSTDNESVGDDKQSMINRQDKVTQKKINTKSNNKLCTIAANIWGTRFKFYGHSSHLPDILGSVNYKTSFLHLQPRQMTVSVANNNPIRQIKPQQPAKCKQVKNPPKRIRLDEDDDQTIVSSCIPIAPMSPQLPDLLSSSTHEIKPMSQISTKPGSQNSAGHRHFQQQSTADSSSPNSPSISPMNLSRSTSPAVSLANFIRPISPPYIQMKEPLSPKFTRTASTTTTNSSSVHQYSTSITTNVDDPTTPDNHQSLAMPVSSVPESCFEPETYRNVSPLNSNQQKKLSFSDPTLNQTMKISRRTQQTTTVAQDDISVSSLQQRITHNDDDIHSDDDIDNLPSFGPIVPEKTLPTLIHQSRKRYTSRRHRILTCASGASDSLPQLSDANGRDSSSETSLYVMQNRPPLWNEQSQVYQLDFGGRVTLESAKNFQIEFKGKQVIQFGRIENNCYTLDFEWPFSPLQAFAVALANITQRLK